MDEQELISRFEKIENRLNLLEGKYNSEPVPEKTESKKDYSGLAGGIRLIVDNGFLNLPKNFKEIREELKREGYHYSNVGIMSTLSETFVKNKRVLTRIKEEKMWKYVLRK